MSKIDLIKEAEDKLETERLEKEKEKVLAEVRFIENRIKNQTDYVNSKVKELQIAKTVLEKEQAAADRYKETGDYEAYKKKLDIKDYSCELTLNNCTSGSTLMFSSVGTGYLVNTCRYEF